MGKIVKLSDEDARKVDAELIRFNGSVVPFTQQEPFTRLQYGIHSNDGSVIAGVAGTLYCWAILYVDALWVRDGDRHRGLGSKLIAEIEEQARKLGCSLSHLDTFDFQAKVFYERLGYEVFGVLDECPPGHKRYFLKRAL
jgi:GNAT superfamily N-acetyltransferase